MVSRNEDQTIKLEMTIDRAELERQLNTVFQGPASGGPGGAGKSTGGKGSTQKPMNIDAKRSSDLGKSLGPLVKLGGIYLGIGAMVKHSQILSTTLGALGSIMGAMMDSFLVPYIPKIIEALNGVSKGIAVAAEAGSATHDILSDLGNAGKNFNAAGPFEKDKMIGQTLLGSMKDLAIIMTPFSQKWGWQTQGEKNKADFEAMGGKTTGMQNLLGVGSGARKRQYDLMMGRDEGLGRIPEGMSQRMAGWSDAQLADFLQRNASNITIQGSNMEEVMENVRAELKKMHGDSNSGTGAH